MAAANDNLADRLVAQHAGRGFVAAALGRVQVRAADGGQRNGHEGLAMAALRQRFLREFERRARPVEDGQLRGVHGLYHGRLNVFTKL